MNILKTIINALKPNDAEGDSSTSSETEEETSSAQSSGQSSGIERDLPAEKAQQNYIDQLRAQESLNMHESLAIGMDETGLAGVTKEQATELERMQKAALAIDSANISLTEIQPKEQGLEIDSPSEGKTVGFEPERGEMPSFPKKTT